MFYKTRIKMVEAKAKAYDIKNFTQYLVNVIDDIHDPQRWYKESDMILYLGMTLDYEYFRKKYYNHDYSLAREQKHKSKLESFF